MGLSLWTRVEKTAHGVVSDMEVTIPTDLLEKGTTGNYFILSLSLAKINLISLV